MTQANKDAVIDMLEAIGQMLELKGENIFKIRAYSNAARALETHTGDFHKAVGESTLTEIPGVGKAIAEKITEAVATGQMTYFETLKAEFPPGIFEMFELQGVGPKKIKVLWDELGIVSLTALEQGCRDGRIAALRGFGKKTADNILKSIEDRKKHSGIYRLGEIAPEAEGKCFSRNCANCRMFHK